MSLTWAYVQDSVLWEAEPDDLTSYMATWSHVDDTWLAQRYDDYEVADLGTFDSARDAMGGLRGRLQRSQK